MCFILHFDHHFLNLFIGVKNILCKICLETTEHSLCQKYPFIFIPMVCEIIKPK
jgi:hypothetical protein